MQFGTHGNASLKTIVSNSGAILTSGDIRSLGVEQFGFFKVTEDGNPAQAQAAPTYKTAPVFQFGRGIKPYLAQNYIGTRQSKMPWLTPELHGENIIKWSGTKADSESTTDIYTLGYDGVDASKRLSGVLDNKELIIRLRLWGTPIRKLMGVAPDLKREYVIDKGCLDLCKTVCEDDLSLADEIIADNFLKQFERDKFNMLPISNFVRVTKLKKCAPAETPITGLVESTEYNISFCDDGTASSIGAIQTQYPGFKIEFVKREGAISTYSMWRLTSQGAPASFTNTVPVSLAVCNECPSGYTLVAEQTVYTVERPIAPSTDLSSPSAQQTYANTIGTAYGAQGRGLATLTGAAGSGYTNGTFPIVFAGGGGTGAAGTITVVGGAITARTITAKGINYTSAPTATFPAAGAGTGGTVVATINAAPTTTSKFINVDGATGVTTFSVDATTPSFIEINSDNFIAVNTASAYCQPPAGASIAWIAGDKRNVAPKTWQLTLADTVCGTSRLAELQGAYPDLVISEEGSSGLCVRVYLATNYSTPVLDEECETDQFKFTQPEPFLFKSFWKPYNTAPLVDPVCTVEDPDPVCCAVGLKFETAAFVHDFSDCVYGYYSYDLSDVDPVYMELTTHTHDWTAAPCYSTDQVVTKLRGAKFATGSGKFIREAERSTLMDEGKFWKTNQAYNEAYGVEFAAKPYEWYDVYKLTIKNPLEAHQIVRYTGTTKATTYAFAFPAGKGKAFEALINGYILSLDNPNLKPVIL